MSLKRSHAINRAVPTLETLACMVSAREGRSENSPAFQRRVVCAGERTASRGTPEISNKTF